MIALDPQAIAAEAIGKYLDAEVELHTNVLRLKKKRTAEVQRSPDMLVGLSLDLNVSFRFAGDAHETVNQAEVFLLPEELPVFTEALIQNPLLLPISYSQHLFVECGVYCIRLASQEPPENFAQRLSEALHLLK
ncbi:hypothetical protein [Planococcus soli]|uniref:hypothetical protein n=1 Tax=Planococcus soli TaxID=2666072 RepID=UPI00115DF42D|nr:hypothetical protein [Planococcus soli]